MRILPRWKITGVSPQSRRGDEKKQEILERK
jgi:hypothetical protein